MKKTALIIAAVCIALCAASCSQDIKEPETYALKVSTSGTTTDVWESQLNEKFQFKVGCSIAEGDTVSVKFKVDGDLDACTFRSGDTNTKWMDEVHFPDSDNGVDDLGDGWYKATFDADEDAETLGCTFYISDTGVSDVNMKVYLEDLTVGGTTIDFNDANAFDVTTVTSYYAAPAQIVGEVIKHSDIN